MRLRPLQFLYQLRWRECDHGCGYPVGSNSHCVEPANAKDAKNPCMLHPFDWRIVRHLPPSQVYLAQAYIFLVSVLQVSSEFII